MKILYDHQAFDMQNYGGVSNCFVKLVSNLPPSIEYDIGLLESDNVHLKNSGLIDIKPVGVSSKNFILDEHFFGKEVLFSLYNKLFPSKTSYGRNRICSIEKLKKGDYDIFHPTFFNPYFLPYLNKKPFVLTVHDMISELFFSSNDVQVKNKPLLCQRATHIIAVSEKTKQDMMEILHVPEEKVTVIYHGAPNYECDASVKPSFEGHYILYVGQRFLYKSFLQMLRFLLPVLLRHQDLKVVCTGPEFSKSEKLYFEKVGLSNRIVHDYVNDQELKNLYAHALCFIYPSVYEGFGIPILEAYSANCPVILNYTSCFPEIAQDAAVYFHMDDNSSDLEQIMEEFLNMTDKEKEALLNKQRRRLSFFSWQKSAKQLAEVYEKLV